MLILLIKDFGLLRPQAQKSNEAMNASVQYGMQTDHATRRTINQSGSEPSFTTRSGRTQRVPESKRPIAMGTKVRIVADGMDRMAYFGSGHRTPRYPRKLQHGPAGRGLLLACYLLPQCDDDVKQCNVRKLVEQQRSRNMQDLDRGCVFTQEAGQNCP